MYSYPVKSFQGTCYDEPTVTERCLWVIISIRSAAGTLERGET